MAYVYILKILLNTQTTKYTLSMNVCINKYRNKYINEKETKISLTKMFKVLMLLMFIPVLLNFLW